LGEAVSEAARGEVVPEAAHTRGEPIGNAAGSDTGYLALVRQHARTRLRLLR
jgi:hypothetical protein